MNITVHSRSEDYQNHVLSCARFYANRLNLENSQYSLHICSKRGLRTKEGKIGVTIYRGKEIFVVLDSKLMNYRLLTTLAHEMVHVKQIARGRYKHELLETGRLQQYWCGKRVTQEYFNRPWEIEAYNKEYRLAEQLIKEMKSN